MTFHLHVPWKEVQYELLLTIPIEELLDFESFIDLKRVTNIGIPKFRLDKRFETNWLGERITSIWISIKNKILGCVSDHRYSW